MAAGEPPIYDLNDHYRILETIDGWYYPQYKGILRWKNYDFGKKHDYITARFTNYDAAEEFLKEKVEGEKIDIVKFKGKKCIAHKVFK